MYLQSTEMFVDETVTLYNKGSRWWMYYKAMQVWTLCVEWQLHTVANWWFFFQSSLYRQSGYKILTNCFGSDVEFSWGGGKAFQAIFPRGILEAGGAQVCDVAIDQDSATSNKTDIDRSRTWIISKHFCDRMLLFATLLAMYARVRSSWYCTSWVAMTSYLSAWENAWPVR